MTVAACILAATPESALRVVDGVPNVRRLADVAWAGGAFPIVVVAPDPDGSVVHALAGSEAAYAAPAPVDGGPVGQICRAFDAARELVDATSAALVWPARMGWVDAETVTSLIESHGAEPGVILRPAFRGDPGWPVLLPVEQLESLRALAADLMPPQLVAALAESVPSRLVDLGDPGATHDIDTPAADLPPFEGPPEPAGAGSREWGAAVAATQDEPAAPPRIVR